MGKSIIDFINKILDTKKFIFRLWIVLWLCLLILLVLKFCFGIWYPIVSNNETFNNICKFIDERLWLYQIISFILYFTSFNIVYLTCTSKKKYSKVIEFILINLLIISCGIVKIYFSSLVGNILEIVSYFILFPIINIIQRNYNRKIKDILIPIIVYAVLNLWQFNILIVRNTSSLVLNDLPIIFGIIITLDYYLFLIIMWIGVSYMGWFSVGWFFGKDITALKAEKDKELSKTEPNMTKVKEIEKRIKELETEA